MTEWTQRKVSDLIDGLRAGVSVRSSPGVDGGPAVLKTSAIKSGRFDPSEVKTILKADLQRAKCPVAADSLIISRMNTPALVGDVGYVDEERADLYLPDRLWLAQKKRNSDTDMRWLTYHFSSEPGSRELRDLATGTSGSMKNIPKNKVLNLVIPTPSPLEQQAIADAIADADGLIESLKRLISKKQAIKQGMMQQLLSGVTRLDGFTGSWDETRLGTVLKFQVGYPFQSSGFSKTTSGMRLVRNRDLRSNDSVIFFSGVFSEDFILADGDILVGMDGDFEPIIWKGGPALLNQRVGRLILSRHVNGAYLSYALEKPLLEMQNSTGATTVKHLSHRDVEDLSVPLPPVEEQEAIAQILQDVDQEIDSLNLRLESARNIKQGMMQELLTGRTRLPVAEVSS